MQDSDYIYYDRLYSLDIAAMREKISNNMQYSQEALDEYDTEILSIQDWYAVWQQEYFKDAGTKRFYYELFRYDMIQREYWQQRGYRIPQHMENRHLAISQIALELGWLR